MTFWQWLNGNWVKILGSIGGLKDALIAAIAGGMFVGLVEEETIKWLAIAGFFLNAWLVQVGNRNTTQERVADAKVEVAKAMETAMHTPPPKSGGFARLGVLLLIGLLGLGSLSFVSGCVGTREAYSVARQSPSDDRFANTAYVVTEHYAAVVHEAADLREAPGTPQAAIDAMREADTIVKAIIKGDPNKDVPSLQSLVDKYQRLRTAETEADLQAALNDAIRELSNFSRAVKAARGRS